MKVSIIVPVYNGEDVLERALDSLLMQKTQYSYEIIIINDCSTDKTQSIINSYSLNHSNIIVLNNKENIGVNESRNKAIRTAKGELIAFLDADDSWAFDKLEKQIKVFNENNLISLCFTDFSIYNEDNSYICNNFQYWKYFKKIIRKNKNVQICIDIFSVIINENVIGTSCVMVRKDKLMETNLFSSELGYSQDWDLWLSLSIGNTFAFINEPLMNYYMMSDSITRKRRTKSHLISIVKKYKNHCDKRLYALAKSNCYAFIGETAFLAKERSEATKYYMKSFYECFQFCNLKKYLWHLTH